MASDEPGGHTFGDTPSGEGEMRASLVSLGSSIAEDISPDFGEVPLPNLDATRDSVSRTITTLTRSRQGHLASQACQRARRRAQQRRQLRRLERR